MDTSDALRIMTRTDSEFTSQPSLARTSSSVLFQPSSGLVGLKASLAQKIRGVAEEQKMKEKCEKKMAADFVRSDPLKVYLKEEKKNDAEKRNSELMNAVAATTKSRFGTVAKRKKKEDDIFKSFGKEHDSNALQTVDGVTRINYKRYWQSDADLGRWQQALSDSSRHNTLLVDVRQRWNTEFKQEQATLAQSHNALFRQRNAVELKDSGPKKQAPAVEELKDLQKKMQGKSAKGVHHRGKKKEDAPRHGPNKMGLVEELNPFQLMHDSPQRSYGEEQVINFIAFCLQHFGNLTAAFHKLDDNHSGAMTFKEFEEVVSIMGFRGDIKFLFYKLDANGDGVVDIDEFLSLKPYMLKEMVRVSMVYMESRKTRALTDTESVWWKFAKSELNESGVLSPVATAPRETDVQVRPSSVDSKSSVDSTPRSPASLVGVAPSFEPKLSLAAQEPTDRFLAWPLGRQVDRASSTQKLPSTISLFIFRNADKCHSGEAVFVKNVPDKLELLVERCAQTCRPIVAPAECLFDASLRQVRSVHQVQKGGTYLLKGKEALDPPPHFFALRHSLPTNSLRCLSDAQLASYAEACSRPCTSQTKLNASGSRLSISLQGSLNESGSTVQSVCRVGSPPELSTGCSPFDKMSSQVLPMHETWQAEFRLNKHLTHGGKNLPPTHKRYDLWMPRIAPEPSNDFAQLEMACSPEW